MTGRTGGFALVLVLALGLATGQGVGAERRSGTKGKAKTGETKRDRRDKQKRSLDDLWQEMIGDSEESGRVLYYMILPRVNGYDPELALKERLARLLDKPDSELDDKAIQRALAPYRERDYKRLYCRDTDIEEAHSSYWGGYLPRDSGDYPEVRARHQAQLKAIDRAMAKSLPPRRKVESLFAQIALEDGHPLQKAGPAAFLKTLDAARAAAVETYGTLIDRLPANKSISQLKMDMDEVRALVLNLWRRFPATTERIGAGVPDEKRVARRWDFRVMRHRIDHRAELDRILADRTPAEALEQLWKRFKDGGSFDNDMRMVGAAEDLIRKKKPTAKTLEELLRRGYGEQIAEYEQRREKGRTQKNASVVQNCEVWIKQLQEQRDELLLLTRGKPPEAAIGRLQGWLLKRVFVWYGLGDFCAGDLVELYRAARTGYPVLLLELESDPDLMVETIRERVAAYWEDNPMAAVALGIGRPEPLEAAPAEDDSL